MDKTSGKYYCDGSFYSFITIGQSISIDDAITRHVKMEDNQFCHLKFYKIWKKIQFFVMTLKLI